MAQKVKARKERSLKKFIDESLKEARDVKEIEETATEKIKEITKVKKSPLRLRK